MTAEAAKDKQCWKFKDKKCQAEGCMAWAWSYTPLGRKNGINQVEVSDTYGYCVALSTSTYYQ